MDKCDTIQCDTINHFYVRSKANACQLDYHTKPRKRYGKIENKKLKTDVLRRSGTGGVCPERKKVVYM